MQILDVYPFVNIVIVVHALIFLIYFNIIGNSAHIISNNCLDSMQVRQNVIKGKIFLDTSA